jgi:transposase
MAAKDIIMMSREEVKRAGIVSKILNDGMRQAAAAEYLGLSRRQVNRIVQRVRKEGERGVVHRLRGRESNRRIDPRIKEKIIRIYCEKYKGFGPTLACEKLTEKNKLHICDETLRKWLLATGDWQKTRGTRKHRHWRERKHQLGEMVQMDGSKHRWLENRGPQLVLLGYIDDATGRIYGRFYPYEGTVPAMDSFKRYVKCNGIPQSIYLDKHTTYKSWATPTIEDELAGVKPMSHFERALKELGVTVIHANSPQAKGRIERLFNTLQDRLVKEMRLQGIKTQKEANEFLEGYLPVYNKQFSVEAKEKGDAHWAIPKGTDLDKILCAKTRHPVRNDFTVVHDTKLYQLHTKTNVKRVVVEERMNGCLKIFDNDTLLKHTEIRDLPEKRAGYKRYRKPTIQPAIPRPRKKYGPTDPDGRRRWLFGSPA